MNKIAKWEYATKISDNPEDDHESLLSEMALAGWRLVHVWYFKRYEEDDWGLMDEISCAKFFFERENPLYWKEINRQIAKQHNRFGEQIGAG